MKYQNTCKTPSTQITSFKYPKISGALHRAVWTRSAFFLRKHLHLHTFLLLFSEIPHTRNLEHFPCHAPCLTGVNRGSAFYFLIRKDNTYLTSCNGLSKISIVLVSKERHTLVASSVSRRHLRCAPFTFSLWDFGYSAPLITRSILHAK